MVQAHIFAHGRVQGVGFRYTVQKRASALALKGYVRNLRDGRVEILAQGSQERVEKLVEFLKNSPGMSYVAKLDTEWGEPDENYSEFEIRF
ncbi:acylphosphatase [Candidatus Poribacteria bacterium]|nr:acylphosphatase [Candidatus Poribacteria bacterium]